MSHFMFPLVTVLAWQTGTSILWQVISLCFKTSALLLCFQLKACINSHTVSVFFLPSQPGSPGCSEVLWLCSSCWWEWGSMVVRLSSLGWKSLLPSLTPSLAFLSLWHLTAVPQVSSASLLPLWGLCPNYPMEARRCFCSRSFWKEDVLQWARFCTHPSTLLKKGMCVRFINNWVLGHLTPSALFDLMLSLILGFICICDLRNQNLPVGLSGNCSPVLSLLGQT